MTKQSIHTVISILFLVLAFQSLSAKVGDNKKNLLPYSYTAGIDGFHSDSIHRIDFRYADKRRGFKPFIAPTALIGAGVALHFSNLKYDIDEWRWENCNYTGDLDDYLRYGPLVAVYGLNLFGVKGKNNLGNQTAILLKSTFINTLVVRGLKDWTKVERPTGDLESFPSGHTALAFGFAQWMHREYGERSVWYSVGAYSCATVVGALRVAKGGHWASDVLAGAGIGMICTELTYLTHQYKWDNEHIKRLDIFPWKTGKHKGLALTYTF